VSGDPLVIDAEVVVRFDSCFTAPVPAISDPCDQSGNGMAYARIRESAAVQLRMVRAPQRSADSPWARVAWLSGTGAGRPEWSAALDDWLATGRSALEWAYTEDVAGRRPTAPDPANPRVQLFAENDDCGVVLADLRIVAQREATGPKIVSCDISYARRRSLVPTDVLQRVSATATAAAGPGPTVDVGTRVDVRRAVTAAVAGHPEQLLVTVPTIGPQLVAPTLVQASSASVLEGSGWVDVPLSATHDAANNLLSLTLTFSSTPANGLPVRIVVAGTGKTPAVSNVGSLVELAGVVGGPPSGPGRGQDVVLITSTI
jgi:hypothetical protein